MGEIALAILALFYAGWIGYGIGKRSGVREGIKVVAAMIEPSHLRFAQAMIDGARKVRDARKFSGAGVSIHNEGDWTIKGVGRFKITIAEHEPADA